MQKNHAIYMASLLFGHHIFSDKDWKGILVRQEEALDVSIK